jgi:hypothetical protein
MMRGLGRSIFVAVLLMIAGVLDIVYGIAAVSNSGFYVAEERYVFSTVHPWGWIQVILGVILVLASLSLMGGRAFGRLVGIIAASIAAIGALLDIAGPHPWWAIGVFALCVICIHGLFVLGEPETGSRGAREAAT